MRASRFVAWITGFAAALVLTPVDRSATQASNFPNHPIKIIIGPSPDIFSRIVAEHLQQTWGQPVVVEPRPGAGGKLAVTAVSTAAPDGHTLLFATPTYTLNTAMKVASYDLLKEFAPADLNPKADLQTEIAKLQKYASDELVVAFHLNRNARIPLQELQFLRCE